MKTFDFIRPGEHLPRPDTNGVRSDADLIHACCVYNYSLGHLVTPEVLTLAETIDEVRLFNAHSGFGAARLVAVDGPAHVGKTTSTLAIAEHQQRRALLTPSPHGVAPITWLYHEATTEGRGKAMIAGLLDACGLPRSGSDSAATMVSRLARTAPEMGLRGIVIDDVHFLTGPKQDGNRVSNILKNLVSTIPATVVLVGLDLRKLPIMAATAAGTSASDQLASRADWVTFQPVPMNVGRAINPLWGHILASLARNLALPRGRDQFKLNQAEAYSFLIQQSGSWPGPAIEWALRATNHAIRREADIDLAALRATQPR